MGLTPEESAAVLRAAAQKGRGDQSIGDFTTGVAPASPGFPLRKILHTADEASNFAKQNGGRGLGVRRTRKGAPAFEATPAALSGSRERLESGVENSARDRRASERNPSVEDRMAELRAKLGPEGFAEFSRVAFRDGLTGALAPGVPLRQDRRTEGEVPGKGTPAAMVSARGLKIINYALGHEAGDAHPRKVLGLRRARSSAAAARLEDPARYASKDFLLIGEVVRRGLGRGEGRGRRPWMDGERGAQRGADGEAGRVGERSAIRPTWIRVASACPGDPGLAGPVRAAANPVAPVVDELVRRLDAAKSEEQGGVAPGPPVPGVGVVKPSDVHAPILSGFGGRGIPGR